MLGQHAGGFCLLSCGELLRVQNKDQSWASGGNLGLKLACETRAPVRVIRAVEGYACSPSLLMHFAEH